MAYKGAKALHVHLQHLRHYSQHLVPQVSTTEAVHVHAVGACGINSSTAGDQVRCSVRLQPQPAATQALITNIITHEQVRTSSDSNMREWHPRLRATSAVGHGVQLNKHAPSIAASAWCGTAAQAWKGAGTMRVGMAVGVPGACAERM